MGSQGLSILDLDFRYPSYGGEERALFRGLSFDLPEGETAALFGGADQGKTTLARILCGLVPRFTGGTLSGALRFRGTDLAESPPYDLTDSVGLVFQNPEEQLLTTRCDSEIAFALESLGVPREEMRRRTEGALELMGLGPLRSRNPATLSGGEKKRLLIACLAAVGPALWILDEAFEELDRVWRVALLDLLSGTGRTALFLDSRWSPLYAARASRFSVLRDGGITCTSADAGSAELRSALAGQGLLLDPQAVPPMCGGPARDAVLQARNVAFQFPGEGSFSVEVPELELTPGAVCSLLGRNGSGKSTLGRLLCGLLLPQGGSVSAGPRAGGSPVRELGRRVGYLFQNPDHQIFLPTVREELALGPRAAGIPPVEADALIEEAIRLFGLPRGDSPPALMSYGARKRLQAATYHLLERDFLILDEIDSGLAYSDFLPLLSALASRGAGLLVITHDTALARAVSGRILVMESGRITRDLSPENFAELDAWEGGGT
jgi:energy-coupling factor transport system ATP-binding protein